MGDRAQIHIEGNGVKLYTHWKAREVRDRLRESLDRGRDRWTDPSYLARIVFDDLCDDHESLTGFGIDTRDYDTRLDVYVDGSEETVVVKEWGEKKSEQSFEEFINE